MPVKARKPIVRRAAPSPPCPSREYIVHDAALAGMGLLVTLEMTVAGDLRAGRLRQVLEAYTGPPLDLYAIVGERASGPRRNVASRALVDHLAKVFGATRPMLT